MSALILHRWVEFTTSDLTDGHDRSRERKVGTKFVKHPLHWVTHPTKIQETEAGWWKEKARPQRSVHSTRKSEELYPAAPAPACACPKPARNLPTLFLQQNTKPRREIKEWRTGRSPKQQEPHNSRPRSSLTITGQIRRKNTKKRPGGRRRFSRIPPNLVSACWDRSGRTAAADTNTRHAHHDETPIPSTTRRQDETSGKLTERSDTQASRRVKTQQNGQITGQENERARSQKGLVAPSQADEVWSSTKNTRASSRGRTLNTRIQPNIHFAPAGQECQDLLYEPRRQPHISLYFTVSRVRNSLV